MKHRNSLETYNRWLFKINTNNYITMCHASLIKLTGVVVLFIDSKGASNADSKYQIKIDGKGVDYKEVANNVNARILSIDFSKDDRFIEISATRMTS